MGKAKQYRKNKMNRRKARILNNCYPFNIRNYGYDTAVLKRQLTKAGWVEYHSVWMPRIRAEDKYGGKFWSFLQ